GNDQHQLRLQASSPQQTLETRGSAAHLQHDVLVGLLAVEAVQHRYPVDLLKVETHPQHGIEQHTATQRHEAHDQRNVEAMPERQAVIGGHVAEYRLHAVVQQRAHAQPGDDADDEAEYHQHLHRKAHPARRFMGGTGQIGGRLAEEHVNEAQRVGHAEHTHGHRRQGHPPVVAAADHQRLGEEHFLGNEAVQEGHAGHGGGGHYRQGGGMRHQMVEPAQLAHIPGAALVVDDTHGHEQGGLEGRVVERMEYGCDHGQWRAYAEQGGDQAQVADGRVGQQAFQVMLEDGDEGAQQQGADPGTADDPGPLRRAGQYRPQAHQQEN